MNQLKKKRKKQLKRGDGGGGGGVAALGVGWGEQPCSWDGGKGAAGDGMLRITRPFGCRFASPKCPLLGVKAKKRAALGASGWERGNKRDAQQMGTLGPLGLWAPPVPEPRVSAGTVIGKRERALLSAISGAVLSCLRVSFCRIHRRLSVIKACCQQSALPWEGTSRGGN